MQQLPDSFEQVFMVNSLLRNLSNNTKKSPFRVETLPKKFRYVDWIIDESVIFGAIHAVQRLESSASKKSKTEDQKAKIE